MQFVLAVNHSINFYYVHEYLKDKINETELNSKNKNIRDLYRGITEFKKGYQPQTNLVKMRGAIFLRILKKFELGGRITSVSY
jgi:hypothetical protein